MVTEIKISYVFFVCLIQQIIRFITQNKEQYRHIHHKHNIMNYINNPLQMISPATIKTMKNMEVLSGSRKFTRKRDSSTESLKKGSLATPKSGNGSFKLNDVTKKRYDNAQDESGLSRLIKTNSYMKIIQSPSTTKVTEITKNYNMDQDEKSTNQQSRLTFEKTTVKQNLSKLYRTPKNSFEKSDNDIFHNYRVLTSTRNLKKYDRQVSQFDDVNCTSRQNTLMNDGYSQKKVLENQIIILEDQNSRLKKQIAQLIQEKQQQKRKRIDLENQNNFNSDKLKNISQQQNDFLLNIQKNIEGLYMQVTRIFGFPFQDINEKINEQNNQLKHEETLSSSGLKESTQINFDNFIQEFMVPACSNIVDCILTQRKIFEQSKLNLSKLQIKQNIMLRNQSDVRKLRDQFKSLNDKYLLQKNRVQRYKQMYEKLKKQFDKKKYSFQIKNKELEEKQMRRSFNLKKSSNVGQDDIIFTLSDASDQQVSPRKKASLKNKS